jgi:hypothetical protein
MIQLSSTINSYVQTITVVKLLLVFIDVIHNSINIYLSSVHVKCCMD